MPFVVDASVTMAWCFEDEATEQTDAILDALIHDTAVVPPLWQLEVVNVLLVAERKGRLGQAHATRFLELLRGLPLRVDDTHVDHGALIAAGRQHGLSAYDAAYLLLAERLGVALATSDERLRSACIASGVELHQPRG